MMGRPDFLAGGFVVAAQAMARGLFASFPTPLEVIDRPRLFYGRGASAGRTEFIKTAAALVSGHAIKKIISEISFCRISAWGGGWLRKRDVLTQNPHPPCFHFVSALRPSGCP